MEFHKFIDPLESSLESKFYNDIIALCPRYGSYLIKLIIFLKAGKKVNKRKRILPNRKEKPKRNSPRKKMMKKKR